MDRRICGDNEWKDRFHELGFEEHKICGQMCDWNDHSWSKYSGPLYPSIDHIVPMSKGGGHVWENVQVAHIICNSEKGDRLEVTDA